MLKTGDQVIYTRHENIRWKNKSDRCQVDKTKTHEVVATVIGFATKRIRIEIQGKGRKIIKAVNAQTLRKLDGQAAG